MCQYVYWGALVFLGTAAAVPVNSEVEPEWELGGELDGVCGMSLRGDWFEPDGDLPHGRMLWKVAGRPLSVVPLISVAVGQHLQPVDARPAGQGSRMLRLPAGRIVERDGGVVLVDADGEWTLERSDGPSPTELLWSRTSDQEAKATRSWTRVSFVESASRKLEHGEIVTVDEAAPTRPDREEAPASWRTVLRKILQAAGVRVRQKAAEWKEALQVSEAWQPVSESRPIAPVPMTRRAKA